MSPRNPETNRAMRERSRQRILAAALELFGSRGFGGTTMAQVAERAGVSKGLAYNYFDSKEAILESLLEEAWQRSFRTAEEAAKREDAAERLVCLVQATLRDAAEEPELTRLRLSLLLQPEAQETLVRVKQRLARGARRWNELLKRTLEELGSDAPETEVALLLSLLNGLTLTWLLSGRKMDLARLERRVYELFGVDSRRKPT